MQSKILFEKAKKVLVGGVNSPVRSFNSVGESPRFIARAKGPRMWDVDDKEYIDYVCSWGAIILGHADPEVTIAVKNALNLGTSYGACHEREIELAELIKRAFPKIIEKVRLCNSGTEATMTALRLARGKTKRDCVVKFAGGYHGHHESLLVSAGSGLMTQGIPSSSGVPKVWAEKTIVLPYSDVHAAEEIFNLRGKEIAAVIVEPVACNMGVVLPKEGFLQSLRRLTKENGSVLIFDEVITGFRLRWGGLSQDVQPDLICLGKIIGGGFPIGAVAGKASIMDLLAPLGDVYHAGTLSGNPIAVTAGITVLKALKRRNPYQRMEKFVQNLTKSTRDFCEQKGIPMTINQSGSLFTLFFSDQSVVDCESAKKTDTKKFAKFFHNLLKRGVYFPPSNFEACFLSAAHTEWDLEQTFKAICKAIV